MAFTFDSHVIFVEDTDKDDENRYHAIGFANATVFVVIVYVDLTENEEEEVIHIVSARKGEAFEELIYADQFN